MRVTVAICTWNRCELLRQALEQMTRLAMPPGVEWELLVVNNNCTDVTDTVIAGFATRLPIRRLFEAKPGKSNALNLAVREAQGEYILWTDDDALVDENWVAAYVKAFLRWPEAAFFGGPVRPWFAVQQPAWLEHAWTFVSHAYAVRDLGPDSIRFDDGGRNIPFGVNWAVRTKDQRLYLYDSRLGPQPGSTIRGDETTLIKALLADGCDGWWVPEAGVRHYIPPERMTAKYIRQFHCGYGEYQAMMEPPWTGPSLFGKPRWVWRQVVISEIRYWLGRFFSKPEIWVKDLINASMAWGYLLKSTKAKPYNKG